MDSIIVGASKIFTEPAISVLSNPPLTTSNDFESRDMLCVGFFIHEDGIKVPHIGCLSLFDAFLVLL